MALPQHANKRSRTTCDSTESKPSAPRTTTSNFFTLPTVLRRYSFQFLPLEDLLATSGCSKQMKDTTVGFLNTCTTITVQNALDDYEPERLLNWLTLHTGNLQRANLPHA